MYFYKLLQSNILLYRDALSKKWVHWKKVIKNSESYPKVVEWYTIALSNYCSFWCHRVWNIMRPLQFKIMLRIHYLLHDKFVSSKALFSKSERVLDCSTIARHTQDFASWKTSKKVMIKKLKAEHRGDNPLSAVLEGFMVFLFALFGLLFVCSL